MGEPEIRQVEGKGWQVTVVRRKLDFDVFIKITPDFDVMGKIQTEKVNLLFLMNSKEKSKKTIEMERRNVPYRKTSLRDNAKITITSKEYFCEVSLWPSFYVSDSFRENPTNPKRKKTKRKGDYSSIKMLGTARGQGKLLSDRVVSKHNNIARPYVGGRCSPK